ncbi:hypothetical protein B0T16DRAFT_193658 [Cercophora newfieldiana]|uniref:BTB domain-containing protein n=1 Tax=Cercophora newfieldiana TaxID=92897 RepID=A0AA39Y3F5_9PEZI|nr:hypothetical protein B0T16DRAFT_193658 [Cercophora newfieldiana]
MMAPVNGASKPAKITARRTAPKVIPVLPLNYPQRPVPKQPSAPPKSSPLAEVQPRPEAVENKQEENRLAEIEPQSADDKHAPAPGPDSNGNIDTPPTISTVTATSAEVSSEPAAPSAALSTGTPTVIAGPADHAVVSPTPTRPDASMPPASSNSSVHGSARATAGSQPPLSFQHAVHQAHPSNGSLIFGGFHDSNASSPAPNPSGGFPAPNMVPPFHHPAPPVDGYGRPFMVSPSYDGFSAMMSHHGPPTPHSIHGSQSSAQAEGHTFGGLWIPTNGNHPPDPTGQLALHGGHYMNPHNTPVAPPTNGSSSVYQNLREQDDALAFLRSGADNTDFHDCFLEMRFPDPAQYQDHPDHPRLNQLVRIPAHRFVLSRSHTLRSLMKAQHVECGGVVVLDLHGEYMRSDVFHYVIRTLYGWSIGDGIPPTDLTVRHVRDDFKLALSYIDASQYLQVGWVHSVAVQRAIALLRWDTLDLAADFILPRAVLSPRLGSEGLIQPEECSIHGLLRQFLAFIVKHFPKHFVLDVNASGGFSRLPISPVQRPKSPAIANGTTDGTNGTANGHHIRQPSGSQTHLSRGQRVSTNPRLSQIKFGDISPPDRNGTASPEVVRSQSRRSPSAHDKVLSRILLNLPYEHLKHVLEAPNLGAGSLVGEITPSARLAMINDIISEREARRLRSLDKSQPQLQFFQDTLEKAAAPLVVNQIGDFLVNNMGHKEEVCPGDIPFLVHTWVSPNSGSVSA